MNNNVDYSSYASNVTDRLENIIQKHNLDVLQTNHYRICGLGRYKTARNFGKTEKFFEGREVENEAPENERDPKKKLCRFPLYQR